MTNEKSICHWSFHICHYLSERHLPPAPASCTRLLHLPPAPATCACLLPPAPASYSCVSRSQEDFQNSFLRCPLHRMHASGKGILLTDQAVDVESALFQEIQSRFKSSAARTNDRDFVNYESGLIDLAHARGFSER